MCKNETVLENKEVILSERINNVIVSLLIWEVEEGTCRVVTTTSDGEGSYIEKSQLDCEGKWYIPVIKDNDIYFKQVEEPIYHDKENELISCSDLQVYCVTSGDAYLLNNTLVYILPDFGKMKACGMNINVPSDLL